MNDRIEQSYTYQLKRKGITIAAVFILVLAIAIGYFASTNARGIRFNRTGTTLSTDQATIFLWGLSVALVTIVLLCIALLVASYRVQQRIAFTKTEVLIPRAFWSSREKQISYNSIQAISIRSENYQRWIAIEHSGGKSYIAEAKLANSQVFEEVVNLLSHKLRNKVRNVEDI
jgi:hypothetical protein